MIKYLKVIKCNYCGKNKFKKLVSIEKQNLVECLNCGLIFLDKQRADIENLYNEGYYKTEESKTTPNYCDYSFKEKIVKNKFKFAFSYISKSNFKKKKLLEIGTGFGYFLKFLPTSLRKSAVEVSAMGAQETKINNPDAVIYQSDFMKQKLTGKYDYIVSFDVIEHQIDLKGYLRKINSLLEKNGVFIFTTPDYGTLLNRALGKRAPAIQPLYHNYYLSKNWIKKNILNSNFKIRYIKTVYFEPIDLGSALLYTTFIFPFLSKTPLLRIVHLLKIDSVVVPFYRLGGIECILEKVDKS